MQEQAKRVPVVIVHDSSSSETDEEPVSNEPIQPDRISSPKQDDKCLSADIQYLFNEDGDTVSSIPTSRIGSPFRKEPNTRETIEHFTERQSKQETPNTLTMYGSDTMDISNEESDEGVTKERNKETETTNQNLENVITHRSHPDLTGCQNNFASHEIDKLVSHLNAFHGCNIDQGRYDADDDKSESSIDKFYSPFDLSTDDDFYAIKPINANKNNLELINFNYQDKNNLSLISNLKETESYNKQSTSIPECNLYLGDIFQTFLNANQVNNIVSCSNNDITRHSDQQISDSLIRPNVNTLEEHTVSLADIEYKTDITPTEKLPTTSLTEKPDTSSSINPKSPTTSSSKRSRKTTISRVTPKVLRSVTRSLTNKELSTKSTNKELRTRPVQKAPISKPETKPPATTKKRPGPKPKSTTTENPPRKKRAGSAKPIKIPDSESSTSSYAPSSSREASSLELSSHEATPELPQKADRLKSIQPRLEREKTPIPSCSEKDITDTQDKDLNDYAPGTEVREVIPAIPRDGLWAFEYGFGFYMKNKYHCNVNRSSGTNACKESFVNKSVFIQHLHYVHHLNAGNALASRESEEDDIIHEKIAEMLVSANLHPSFIKNETFIRMVEAIQKTSQDQVTIPSLEKTQQLMNKVFVNRENQLKKLLRLQKHLSFSIHTFKPASEKDQTMISIVAFYIDKDWRPKDILIRFETLPNTDNLITAIETCFRRTIEYYGISDQVYTIVSPDFSMNDFNMVIYSAVSMCISSTITKRVFTPCLDQIISLAKDSLCEEISTRFGPLEKICRFRTKFLTYSWTDGILEDIELVLKFSRTTFKNCIDMLKEFSNMRQIYNNACRSHFRYSTELLNEDDFLKIDKFLKTITILEESNNWLRDATNQRYPTANKACLIYMEILNSLFQLAQCYGCKDENQMLFKTSYLKSYEDDAMFENVNKSYSIVIKYRILMEGSAENPTWQALILDTFSFGIYTARKLYYSKPNEMSPTMLLDTVSSKKNITLATSAQVLQIKQYVDFKNMPGNESTSGTILPTQLSDPLQSGKSMPLYPNLNQNTKKRGQSSNISNFMSDYKELQKSFNYSVLNSPLKSADDNDSTMLTYLLHRDRNHLGQLDFWKNSEETFYPIIRELTKQCFAVPTTSKECLRVTNEAKIYYYSVINLFPQSSTEENQRRTLLYIWQKYSDTLSCV